VTDLDDLPIFRPRIGRSRKPTSRSGAASFRNAVLSAARRGARAAGRKAAPRSRVAVERPGANARRVVVKAHLLRMSASGAKAAALHVRYIERDGVEKDGSKGVLYDADGPARAEAFEQPRPGEKHQFRLIVSPEDAGELDLTDYVRRLMATVERDVDRKLEWAAVNHHDTGHPHVHIVIRGVDRDGREVRLDRGYISNGLRGRAQELATEELGPRHQLDVRRTYAKEITQDRFTALDREIERRAKDNHVELCSAAQQGPIDRSTLVARLRHLEVLRLAERLSPTSWKLTERWQEPLRELGSRGDILKQIHAAISGDPARYHIVRPGQAVQTHSPVGSQVLSGRVASKGLSDELKGTFYAVIETPTGRAYHVPLDPRAAETMRPGDIVSFTTKPEAPVRPVDRQIADVARAQGGVFTLERPADNAPHPHERRLRELERLGLATPEAPHRWKVSPNLLQGLAERQRDTPVRHRLLLHKEPLSLQAQLRHPGPVWLDRVKTDSLAPYGFGAELRRAVEQRREALRRLGVQPDDPNRSAALRELQRRAVGGQIAARSRQAFLPSAPDGFRGRVQLADAGPSGTAYAVVSDGQRFVVLRATVALRASHGKAVTFTRDAKGRLLVRPAPDKGIGFER
jgi:type IV secretory pathway VirD2 relaxase